MKKIVFLTGLVLVCVAVMFAEAGWTAQAAKQIPKSIVIPAEATQKIEMVAGKMRFLAPDVVSQELRTYLESIEWIELPCFFTPFDQIALERAELPREFKLHQNYPNPFNLSTVIGFSLPEASEVKLEIFNLAGQRIACPFEGQRQAGHHEITWDGRDEHGQVVATGVYFCRLTAGDFTDVKKMNLVK